MLGSRKQMLACNKVATAEKALILTITISITASDSSRASERVVEILHPKPGEEYIGPVHFKIHNPNHDSQHGFLSPSLIVYGRIFNIRILIDGGVFDLRNYIQSLGRGAGRRNEISVPAEDCEQKKFTWGREICFSLSLQEGQHRVEVEVQKFSSLAYRVSSSFTVRKEREEQEGRGEQVEEQDGRAQQAVRKECRHQNHLFNESEASQVFALKRYSAPTFYKLVACSLLIPTLVFVEPKKMTEKDFKVWFTCSNSNSDESLQFFNEFFMVANSSHTSKMLLSFAVLENCDVKTFGARHIVTWSFRENSTTKSPWMRMKLLFFACTLSTMRSKGCKCMLQEVREMGGKM
eukprot:758023-Hanusia_phi.AAC.3